MPINRRHSPDGHEMILGFMADPPRPGGQRPAAPGAGFTASRGFPARRPVPVHDR